MYSCQDILYNRNVSNGFEDKNKYLTDQVLESTIIHFQRKWLEHVFNSSGATRVGVHNR